MSGYFVTEFGHKIDFVPDYFARNNFYSKFAKAHWQKRRPYEGETIPTEPLGYYMVAKDWVLFSSLVSFLDRHGLLRQWERGIDLGGAEGTVIRLLRASGLVQDATNLDMVDFSGLVSDEFFSYFIERISQTDWATDHTHPVTDAIIWAKVHLNYEPKSQPLNGLVGTFPHTPTAKNIVSNVYDATGSYDLVLANALLEFVDLDKALPKIRSLMTPDSLFVGCLNTCWCPVTPNGLVGDFPYMAQRLTLNDTRRYLEEARPDEMFNLEDRYNYFHEGKQRPSLSQLIEHFNAAGLTVLAAERISPPYAKRYSDTPAQLFAQNWFKPDEIMRDVSHINPTVTLDDLKTTAVRIAARITP